MSGFIDRVEVSMEAKTFEVEFTLEQREELGREAHAAALRHCSWENLFPAVQHAYCEQGVRVARLALLMVGREVERPAEGARAPLSYVTNEGVVRVPDDVRAALGVTDGGGVTFVEGKDGFFYMLTDAQLLGMRRMTFARPAPAAVASVAHPMPIAESARVPREPAKGPPPVPQESRMGEVFAFIQARGEVMRAEIGSHFGLSKGAVDGLCFRLRHAGLIERKRKRGQPERAVNGAAVAKATKRPRAQQTQDTVHERLVAFVEERGRVSTTEIQKQLGLTREHVHTALHVLRIGKRIAPATGDGFAMSLKFAASLTKVPAPAPRAAAAAGKPAPSPSPPVKAKSSPPSPPVESRVVEVEFITGRDSRFRCLPLRCVLTAGSCVDRQAKATGGRSGADSKALASRKEANAFAACKACPLGKRVAQQLAAHATPTEAQS